MQVIDDMDDARDERRQKRLFWAVCLLGWSAPVAVTASFMAVAKSLPFLVALLVALGFWGFYALVAPLVLRLARRFPLNRWTWRYNIWVHLVGAIVFVVFCEGGFAGVLYLLGLQSPREESSIGVDARWSLSPWNGDFEQGLPRPAIRILLFKSQFGFPLYWVLVGMAHSLAAMTALREREKQAAQLAAHLARAQLAGLRTQLQPHFLFNTLNSVAALIPQDTKLATEMVMNLSDLLRMTLRESQQGEIPLREELTLLRYYVDIQRLRFGDRLVFEVEATDDALDAVLPPLLLQPLVENAVRHGLEASDKARHVIVRGSVANQELHLEVVDTCGEEADERHPLAESTGVGLANTRARLEAQYGELQRFQAGPLAGGGFRVTMRIPARTNPSPRSVTSHDN